jgi:RimJ/RimL family protein N-acetyltransferase
VGVHHGTVVNQDDMRPTLHTDRLRLEPTTEADLPRLVELNSDPEVMRYILGRAATAEETRAEWDERLTLRTDEERGLGYWCGFLDGGFVGWWSASSVAENPAVAGLGYRLRREGWGVGLATEGARAMVRHAFSVPGIEAVHASTMAINTGSRQVLSKVGMRHTRTDMWEWDEPIPGWEQGDVVYELERGDYSQ